MTRAIKIVIIMIEKIATETRRGRREEKRAKTRAIGNNNNNNKQKSLGKTDKQGTFQKDKRPRSTMAIISTNQSRLMMIYKMKRRLKIHILRRQRRVRPGQASKTWKTGRHTRWRLESLQLGAMVTSTTLLSWKECWVLTIWSYREELGKR